MPVLNIVSNDPTKPVEDQLKQTSINVQDLVKYSNQILSKTSVDYTEPSAAANETTTSSAYVNIANFTKNFTINNPLCVVNFVLTLKGNGVISLFINGQLIREIPFNTANFNIMTYYGTHILRTGANQVQLKWRSRTGTITKAMILAENGLNFIQVTSLNS